MLLGDRSGVLRRGDAVQGTVDDGAASGTDCDACGEGLLLRLAAGQDGLDLRSVDCAAMEAVSDLLEDQVLDLLDAPRVRLD